MNFLTLYRDAAFYAFIIILFFNSCNNSNQTNFKSADTLSSDQIHLSKNALRGLEYPESVHVEIIASENMIKNPTNIDVDDRGRIWVLEAYNYRPAINGNPTNPKGDRIVILEDVNGDGIMDSSKVFYQGPEINAPLGICVLGDRVIVSQSPYVWVFYDDNKDDHADRKEILFQGIGGEQHDHGVHSFVFAPDGKLYFNFGNEGVRLKDKFGKPVLDQDRDSIGPNKYQEGMAFRCDPDGSNVECLGHNFRNPFELTVDSYGTVWQSDNDDDGNRGTRILYLMEHGGYGYKDELTRAGWSSIRNNMEDSTPYRHWHLNDPGVVPNMLQTGAGSPSGITYYEGNALPQEFNDKLIHCDPGVNVVRSYPISAIGSGYTADSINILKGSKDDWFRPIDVCAAPDGSLIVADWYDPGVGGHAAGDQNKGRIYRISKKGRGYEKPLFDFSTAEGAVVALQNANQSVRFKAWTTLQKMGDGAINALEKLWKSNADPKMRARAFWALIKISKSGEKYIPDAIKDSNPNIRIAAIRGARQIHMDMLPVWSLLSNDDESAVRREVALAIRHINEPAIPSIWVTLASQYDGKDRWYLEALGIGADKQWDSILDVFLSDQNKKDNDPVFRDIIWRSRSSKAIPFLAKWAGESNVPLKDRLRYFRALDFQSGSVKQKLLLAMLNEKDSAFSEQNKVVLGTMDMKTVMSSVKAKNVLRNVLATEKGSQEYIALLKKYKVQWENNSLLDFAAEKYKESLGRESAGLLLEFNGEALLKREITGKDTSRSNHILKSLGGVGSQKSLSILQYYAFGKSLQIDQRKIAANMIGKSWAGEEKVLQLLKDKKVPAMLIADVVYGVKEAWRTSVRTEAESYLTGNDIRSSQNHIPLLADVKPLKGNINSGKSLFVNSCNTCHKVGSEGNDFGPALTEIGTKLSVDGLYESIVHPSKGISFGFEGWDIIQKDGTKISGIISSKTETDMEIKMPLGQKIQIKTSSIKSMKKMSLSMMPEGLINNMSKQEVADLLGYLRSLKH